MNNKNKYNNISIINLGQCENLLIEEYNISNTSNLYILKIDTFLEGIKIPKVEYEVYYSESKNKFN